ncbi:MAG TPA: SRPBCC family protein [Polyangiaceae bacterium]|nr:SRPBCC family protein [Polyangiaceae bacterium]
MSPVPDRIEKKVVLRAPRARVWRAISDSREFGAWFGMRLEGPFVAGATLRGAIVPTTVDAAVAAQQKPHEGLAFDIFVERVEPERLLSFRWHPYAIEPGTDYSAEPTTLVEFELADHEGGVLLTVTESGFDEVPLARRAEAFTSNEGGWAMQVTLIAKYLARAA